MKWFELGLVVLTFATGLIWLLDRLFFARRRAERDGLLAEEPMVVDYSRAFFPVLAVVLVLRSFVAIIDEGSFAAAARRMGISKSMCSKMIADLEADLGTRLLTRTTRAVTPTAAGLGFHAQVADILSRLDAAFEDVRAASSRPCSRSALSSSTAARTRTPH